VGHDTYALMREPEPGGLVLHLYKHSWPDGVTETRLCGHSLVSATFREVTDEPPSPGAWADMAPYYRIELKGTNRSRLPYQIPCCSTSTAKSYGTTRWKRLLQEHSTNLTSAVVPIPSRELREMLPPIRSISSWQIDNPSPKPVELPFPR
jgi:hypothetical protein